MQHEHYLLGGTGLWVEEALVRKHGMQLSTGYLFDDEEDYMSEKKWDFKHTETDTQNLTTVNMGPSDGNKTAEELKKKYEKRSILVKIKDDNGIEQEFYAVDFKTFTDQAGDPVLHFKFKAENLILYLTTPHPDSLKCLQDLKNSVRGFPFEIEIRDYTGDLKEMLRLLQQKEVPGLNDGIHPEMKSYIEKDFVER